MPRTKSNEYQFFLRKLVRQNTPPQPLLARPAISEDSRRHHEDSYYYIEGNKVRSDLEEARGLKVARKFIPRFTFYKLTNPKNRGYPQNITHFCRLANRAAVEIRGNHV